MNYSVIIIGDEILLGQVVDTNSGSIARILEPMGMKAMRTLVVGDDGAQIRAAVEECLADCDLVIATGGLGPTKDDITKKTLAELYGCGLVHDEAALANVKRVFAMRNLELNESTCSQAMVPEGCEVVQNLYGTAPIMWFDRGGKVLVSMPGVPFETVGMMQAVVAEKIRRRFASDTQFLHCTLMVSGITESALSERLEEFEAALPQNMHLAYLPTAGFIRLRLDGQFPSGADTDAFEQKHAQLKRELGGLLIFDGDATIAEILLAALKEKGLTIASAESCTGGMIASRITSVPGSSECFMGGVVSYSNSVKEHVLGVSAEDLQAYGAVSEQVARQMAEGACRVCGADCAVATTGIAGPGGGTPAKPVGTVWTAVCVGGATTTRLLHLPGNRARVVDRAATEVMLDLIRALQKKET